MSQQPVNVGTVANDGTGDFLRDAFVKLNANDAELYSSKANLASPVFTGTPAAPTASPGANTTQLATTAFVTAAIALAVTGVLKLKGFADCSSNPSYPGASKGDAYVVTVAGRIGGASGTAVEAGDVYVATADNAGGTQASVGASWDVLQYNLVGALIAANNLADVASAATARANLGAQAASAVLAYLAGATSADAAGVRTLLSLVPGTNVQAYSGVLAFLAGAASSNAAGIRALLGLSPDPGTMTITAGAGAGTGPTIAITNGPNGGRITLTTGTTPTLNGVIATITYGAPFSTDSFVVLSPENSNAAAGYRLAYVSGTTSGFTLTNGTAALTASTQYIWDFTVSGK